METINNIFFNPLCLQEGFQNIEELLMLYHFKKEKICYLVITGQLVQLQRRGYYWNPF